MAEELYPKPPVAEAPPPPMPPEPKPLEIYPGWDKERVKWEKEFEKTKKTLATTEERIKGIEAELEKTQEPLPWWRQFLTWIDPGEMARAAFQKTYTTKRMVEQRNLYIS